MMEDLRNVMDIDKELTQYENLDYTTWTDNEFFEALTRAIFTGIKNNIIADRWAAITDAFSNFNIRVVAKYTEKDVKRLMKNRKIIRHKERIKATISNAKKTEEIIREYGSFVNYVDSFEELDELIGKLQEEFKYIGEINVYEFAKELGLPFIKPDRQARKVFLRLGLIDEKASSEEIVEIGKVMAKAVKERPCVVDCVIWRFGQKVCAAKPECKECSLINLCEFQH